MRLVSIPAAERPKKVNPPAVGTGVVSPDSGAAKDLQGLRRSPAAVPSTHLTLPSPAGSRRRSPRPITALRRCVSSMARLGYGFFGRIGDHCPATRPTGTWSWRSSCVLLSFQLRRRDDRLRGFYGSTHSTSPARPAAAEQDATFKDLARFQITVLDFVHAISSAVVFLAVALPTPAYRAVCSRTAGRM